MEQENSILLFFAGAGAARPNLSALIAGARAHEMFTPIALAAAAAPKFGAREQVFLWQRVFDLCLESVCVDIPPLATAGIGASHRGDQDFVVARSFVLQTVFDVALCFAHCFVSILIVTFMLCIGSVLRLTPTIPLYKTGRGFVLVCEVGAPVLGAPRPTAYQVVLFVTVHARAKPLEIVISDHSVLEQLGHDACFVEHLAMGSIDFDDRPNFLDRNLFSVGFISPTEPKISPHLLTTNSIQALSHNFAKANDVVRAVSSAIILVRGPESFDGWKFTVVLWVKTTNILRAFFRDEIVDQGCLRLEIKIFVQTMLQSLLSVFPLEFLFQLRPPSLAENTHQAFRLSNQRFIDGQVGD
jgi:hypothetical protein